MEYWGRSLEALTEIRVRRKGSETIECPSLEQLDKKIVTHTLHPNYMEVELKCISKPPSTRLCRSN